MKSPSTAEDIAEHTYEFSEADMPGAFGSTDAVNIVIEKCTWKLRQAHLGYKQALTARSYNVTVNHRRRILHCTDGHPARWNDKTLVKFDALIRKLAKGKIATDNEFILLE